MKVSELTGEARKLYESWHDLGYSESQALEEVERSGIVVEEQLTTMFERLGLSPEAARYSAQGRDGGAERSPFDEMVKMFEARGLSHEAARAAAIGRDGTEAEVRQALGEVAKSRMVREGALEETKAFREAVRVAGRFHGKSREAATTWIKKKIEKEFASLPLEEGVAGLRDYARTFGSRTAKRDRYEWAVGDLEEVTEDTDTGEQLAERQAPRVAELREVVAGWPRATGGN